MNMATPSDERDKSVDLPAWWLEKVRELVDERKETLGESLGQLADALAVAVGHDGGWDHSKVSRFLRNKNTTAPMAEAFAILLGIPRPFFVPRSFDEALSLQQVVGRYDTRQQHLTAEQRRRLSVVDEIADLAKNEDQIRPVVSDDHERASRGRRPGRTSRGR
jgi:hypothetical protein